MTTPDSDSAAAAAAPSPWSKREKSVLGALGKVAALKQEQVGEGSDEVVALLPINFFSVKKDATPKAPLSVLVKVAILAYIITMGIGFGLFYYELTAFTVTEETTVSPTPISGQTCTALGAWTNEVSDFKNYVPYRTAVGIEAQIDISWTKEQCLAATADTCETWADAYVGEGTDASCCMSSAAVDSNCYSAYPPAPPAPPTPSPPPYGAPSPPRTPATTWSGSGTHSPPRPPPPPPPPAAVGVNYCGGTKVATMAPGNTVNHPAFAPFWFAETHEPNPIDRRTQRGWSLWRGSGMLSSVAVVDDTSTTTRDVPGIHVASEDIYILEADENGIFQSAAETQLFNGGSLAPKSHEAHFKALANAPRSMLALTTCAANSKPSYTCTGAGIGRDGRSSIDMNGGRFDGQDDGLSSLPDYLTSKIWARYPRLGLRESEDPDGDSPLYAGQLLDFKLPRSAFVADCNAATIEVCNKAEEQCQPFLCKQEVKTYKSIVEAFGIAFANYGLATAVLMPLFALLAARIGRKQAGAAGETTVSVPHSERNSVSEEI